MKRSRTSVARGARGAQRVRLELLEPRCLMAASITVNTAVDSTAIGTTLSLRQAIEISNGTLDVSTLSPQQQALVTGTVGSTNTIGFAIPNTDPGFNASTGVWTIGLTSALPTIATNAAIINGYSQTNATRNTLAVGDNAKLTLALSGAGGGTNNGLSIDAEGTQVSGLDIENFGGDGILITAGGQVSITGSFIGTDPTGETAAPNGTGVVIENSFNTIGGPDVGDRNVISGNTAPSEGDGVYLPELNLNPLGIVQTGNVIENNYIGMDAAGTKAISNSQAGIADFGSGNTYGGTAPGQGNVVTGNGGDGIKATGSFTAEGNFIGVDATGNVGIGNGPAGVGLTDSVFPATQVITTVITNNVVSGNLQGGISVTPGVQSTSVYTISNNRIGTNADGTAAIGNVGSGLILESVENTTVTGNIVSANTIGIQLSGFGTDVAHNVFQGNIVGSDVTGTKNFGNTAFGISVTTAIGNTFGGTGPGQGNIVAFNGNNGINVTSSFPSVSKQDQFTENSIFGNTGAGIKLGPGGTNNFAEPPTMTFTPGGAGTGTLAGSLVGAADNATYVVEIFSNLTVPTVGQEQGKTFVESVNVTTNGTGVGTFSVTLPTGIYTATQTDSIGNTSAFSAAVGSAGLPASTTTVASSLNPSTFGQSVTFTAVVTAPSFPGTPTGDVTFSIDGVDQTPVALSVVGGVDQAQFVTSSLSVGAHTITATYGGEARLNGSTGSLPTQTVNAAAPVASTTTVTSSLNPSTFGQSVTFTAVVAAPGFGGTPTGDVTFSIDGVDETPVALTVVGGVDQAQFVTSSLSVGAHSVSATYAGDANVSGSNGALPTQTVNAALPASTTTVTSSLNPSTVGQSVTFTAVVAAPTFGGTPTGDVTFTIDGVDETPVALTVVGGVDQAQFVTSSLTVGSHTVAATYAGDGNVTGSNGSLPTQTVDAKVLPASTTTVTSSLNPSMVGQSVTFTAVVTAPGFGGTPTGDVTFAIDGQNQTPVALTVVGGVDEAQFVTSSLTVGSHTVTAAYGGDANVSGSNGSLPTQTVNPGPVVGTSTVLTSDPSVTVVGQVVVFTATVTATDGSPVTGIVDFVTGSTVLGTGAVGTGGVATFDDSTLPVGTTVVTAVYTGDPGHSQSTSNPVTQTVLAPSVVAPVVVTLERFGFHMQQTTVVLHFSTALEAATAIDTANYQIVTLGGHGRFGNLVGHKTPVKRALYNPETFTVTLRPLTRLDIHNRYRLTVNGEAPSGVRGSTGLFLNGTSTSGQDYVATIDRGTLAGPAPGFPNTPSAASAKLLAKPSAAGVDSLAVLEQLSSFTR